MADVAIILPRVPASKLLGKKITSNLVFDSDEPAMITIYGRRVSHWSRPFLLGFLEGLEDTPVTQVNMVGVTQNFVSDFQTEADIRNQNILFTKTNS